MAQVKLQPMWLKEKEKGALFSLERPFKAEKSA